MGKITILMPYRYITVAAVLLCATIEVPSAQPAGSNRPGQAADAGPVVSELMGIVGKHGWAANLGRMCVVFRHGAETECKFKQIAVSGGEPGTLDNHGFNVPLTSTAEASYVLIFHLGPLVGNFFLVSPKGELKASYYRAKGVDYTEIPTEEAGRAFAGEITFWRENLPKLKESIAAGNPPRR